MLYPIFGDLQKFIPTLYWTKILMKPMFSLFTHLFSVFIRLINFERHHVQPELPSYCNLQKFNLDFWNDHLIDIHHSLLFVDHSSNENPELSSHLPLR